MSAGLSLSTCQKPFDTDEPSLPSRTARPIAPSTTIESNVNSTKRAGSTTTVV